ncbi:MAG: VWA domain-containing protein [Oceanicoccus sp.]
MQTKLVSFIGALRKHDVRISTAETLDAMRVMALIGYSERDTLKMALASTLAKTKEEKALFDHCFELFYGGERLKINQANQDNDKANNSENSSFDLQQEIADNPLVKEALDSPLVQMLMENDPAKLTAAMAKAASEVSMEKLRYFTQTGQYSRKLLEQLDTGQIDDSIEQLQGIQDSTADFVIDILQNRKQQLREIAKQQIEEHLLLTANAEGRKLQEDVLRSAKLSSLERKHFDQLQELVRKLAKKLSSRHSQRMHVEKRGKLDVGKTLRKNVHLDGIMFETYWKKKRKDQPKVIAFCDVSNSVAAYAKFLLLFLYSLSDVIPKVRSFCFSNRTGEVTDLFNRYEAAQAMEMAFKQWGQGSSDYGQSLVDFADLCLEQIDKNTTVIILGDARNNYGDARLDVLQKVYNRAKTVIFLNPERRSQWNTGDSEMRRYQSASHFSTECQSLQQLERIVDQLLTLIR